MVKRIINEDRKNRNLKPKEIILISCEGKTEKEYFSSFSGVNKNYRILFAKGNQTDPVNLVRNLSEYIKNNNYNEFENFSSYCVFDIDTFENKEKMNLEAIKLCTENNIIPITSTPCIELWFLLHFKNINAYITSKDAIKELKGYLPNYSKGNSISNEINSLVDTAIKNAKKLEKMQIDNGKSIGTIDANPNSEVYKLIEKLK